MEHRLLGRTGVSVSKLCLGAMMFGEWGTRDHDESIKIIHRALDAGINFIDTAKQGALTCDDTRAPATDLSAVTIAEAEVCWPSPHRSST
jgi:predicted oxidoreductase